VEIQATSVEEAVRLALETLGVPRDQVQVEILAGAEPDENGDSEVLVRVSVVGGSAASSVVLPEVDDPVEWAEEALGFVVRQMGFRASVVRRQVPKDPDAPSAILEVKGQDVGLLIGHSGETLAALQYLLNLMVSRRFKLAAPIEVDVEGYRQRRRVQLEALARKMAESVARTGHPVELQPMPARDRRIIHVALSNHPHVRTESTGEGEERRVTILPK
jgi:spoIIIJ-associated protein